ncbi:hypothetical protein HDU77_003974 [Chytriomyces hyalinus]|nr:hypothetical protein HDU77_003974 [Chytriomyces hyalinus]
MPANNSSDDTDFLSILNELTPSCSPTAAFNTNQLQQQQQLFHVVAKPSFHVHPESQEFVFASIAAAAAATQFGGGVNEFPRQSQITVFTAAAPSQPSIKDLDLPIPFKSAATASIIPIKSTSNPPPIPPTKPIKRNCRRRSTQQQKKKCKEETILSIDPPISSRSRDFQCTTCEKRHIGRIFLETYLMMLI